jgi:hypothetical protein
MEQFVDVIDAFDQIDTVSWAKPPDAFDQLPIAELHFENSARITSPIVAQLFGCRQILCVAPASGRLMP